MGTEDYEKRTYRRDKPRNLSEFGQRRTREFGRERAKALGGSPYPFQYKAVFWLEILGVSLGFYVALATAFLVWTAITGTVEFDLLPKVGIAFVAAHGLRYVARRLDTLDWHSGEGR